MVPRFRHRFRCPAAALAGRSGSDRLIPGQPGPGRCRGTNLSRGTAIAQAFLTVSAAGDSYDRAVRSLTRLTGTGAAAGHRHGRCAVCVQRDEGRPRMVFPATANRAG
jgi:hypothetical protein